MLTGERWRPHCHARKITPPMVFPRRSLAVLHRRDLIIVANDGGSKALPSMERQGTAQTVRVSLSFSAPFSTPSGYTAIISLKRAGQTDGQTAGSLTSDCHDETTLYVPFENFVTTSSIQLYIPPRFVCFSYRRDFVDLVAVVKVSLPRVRGEIDWYLELGSRRVPFTYCETRFNCSSCEISTGEVEFISFSNHLPLGRAEFCGYVPATNIYTSEIMIGLDVVVAKYRFKKNWKYGSFRSTIRQPAADNIEA